MYRVWARNKSNMPGLKSRLEALGIKTSWITIIEEGEPMWIEAALTAEQRAKVKLELLVGGLNSLSSQRRF